MKAVTFTINLLEPLLATGLEGDPNSGVSQNYISGSVLRGAVIGLYLRDNHKKTLDLTPDERKLFFNGTVHFLNSYPVVNNSNLELRSLPTPLAWQKEKDEDGNDFKNFCVKERDSRSYKNLTNPFFAFEADDAYSNSNEIVSFTPKTRLAVHINRSITGNTGGDNSSQVFRYQSIAEDTKFSGAILSECETCLKQIEELIKKYKKVNFGGSRTAGYGKAEFINVELVGDWHEPQVSENIAIEKGNIFSITLLSNALIRDDNGQLQAELTSKFLGIDAEPCEKKTFKRIELIGGFNRKWGLPLQQQLSIKQGSVFTFTANEPITADKIKELHTNGIGERKLDGFGRIAVNLNNEDGNMNWRESGEKPADATYQSDFAAKMIMRILRQKMDSQLISLINRNKIVGGIRNSQISRLRLHIRELLRETTITKDIAKQKIDGFFNKLRSTALKQFQSAKIGNKKLDDWVKETIANVTSFDEKKRITLGGKLYDNDNLLVEYHLYLIDGVLAQATKENE